MNHATNSKREVKEFHAEVSGDRTLILHARPRLLIVVDYLVGVVIPASGACM
jgi:hypothetical protein